MSDDAPTGRRYVTTEQYADDRNLAARQSLYRFAEPGPPFWEPVLGLIGWTGEEGVLDAGCGNGTYLRPVAERAARIVGMDLSHGMLVLAREARAGKRPAWPWPTSKRSPSGTASSTSSSRCTCCTTPPT